MLPTPLRMWKEEEGNMHDSVTDEVQERTTQTREWPSREGVTIPSRRCGPCTQGPEFFVIKTSD